MALLKNSLAAAILALVIVGLVGCQWESKPTVQEEQHTGFVPTHPTPPPDSYASPEPAPAPETKAEPQSNWGEGTMRNLEHPSN